MDNDFANRAQVRRHRQATSPFSTQRIEAISGDSDNTRKLLIAGAAVLGLALLFLLFRVFSNFLSPADNTALLASPSPRVTASPAPLAGAGDDLDADTDAEVTTPASEPEATPAASPAPTGDAFVVTGTDGAGLRLREEPSTDADVIDLIPEGTEIEATGDERDDGTYLWRRVRTPVGEGWVADNFLTPASEAGSDPDSDTDAEATTPASEPEATPAASPAPTGDAFVVTGTDGASLRLRASASTEAEVIGALPEGTEVTATGEQQQEGDRLWRRVRTPDGEEGWVADEFLTPASQ